MEIIQQETTFFSSLFFKYRQESREDTEIHEQKPCENL